MLVLLGQPPSGTQCVASLAGLVNGSRMCPANIIRLVLIGLPFSSTLKLLSGC